MNGLIRRTVVLGLVGSSGALTSCAEVPEELPLRSINVAIPAAGTEDFVALARTYFGGQRYRFGTSGPFGPTGNILFQASRADCVVVGNNALDVQTYAISFYRPKRLNGGGSQAVLEAARGFEKHLTANGYVVQGADGEQGSTAH